MTTLSSTSSTSLPSNRSIAPSPNGSQRSAGLFSSPSSIGSLSTSPRLGQRSSLASNTPTRSATRVRSGFVLRGLNPVVTGISGNGTTSTFNVQQMHNGGTWTFSRNGTFQFTPRGLGTFARTDLFPISGRYQINGSNLRFSGSRSSSNLTSRNFAAIGGTISLRNGIANIAQRTALIMAANVGGVGFGQNIDRTVGLRLRMVRVA